MPHRRRTIVRLFAIALLTLASALASANGASANVTRGCLTRFDPAADYFPDKVRLEDASLFTVDYRRSYKVVTVREPYPGGAPERYVLVQCGAPTPALTGDLAGAQIIPIPISSLYSGSTTHLPLLVELGRLDVLTGVARLSQLTGDAILQHAAKARVREFAPASVIDTELVAAGRPSLLMAGGSASASLGAVRQAGVPVVANAEWLESTALARAEWLKYMALFLNEERAAQQLHAAMKGRYQAIRAKATSQPRAAWPLVMTGRSTRGRFVIAGGRSYVAAMIADAGGRYVWADNGSTGAPSVDLELQITRAAQADIWINGGGWKDLADMLADEPRYAELKPYRTGQVWVYERRQQPSGANDYWSRSISRPDLVLADLVKIFHPALLPDHAFEWYMPVPRTSTGASTHGR